MQADRHDGYTVFAQHALALGALRAQGARFFDAKVGFAADRIDEKVDVMIAHPAIQGTRRCIEHLADAGDYAAAEAAERAQQTHGMSLLAARCPRVWRIAAEDDADRAALLIAAIFASTLLGPILAPSGTELFGVRTARLKLGLV